MSETKLCECGCGQPAPISKKTDSSNGRVKGQPQRFVAGHSARMASDAAKRVTIKTTRWVIDEATGCWNWILAKNTDGYGAHWVAGGNVQAHRFYYKQKYGPLPDDIQLDHLCRNRACVNPEHLEPVTNQVNTQRGLLAKINPTIARTIRDTYGKGGITMEKVAKILGTSEAVVWAVVHRKAWNNV